MSTPRRAFTKSLADRIVVDERSADGEKRYWLVMQYGCKACGFEMDFYLEEGCEGPRDRTYETFYPKDHPIKPGRRVNAPMTASGRPVVPVPFVAGRCADCGEDSMTHIRWNEDRVLDPMSTSVPEDAGVFFYPSHSPRDLVSIVDSPCGRPVYPKARPAGSNGADAE